MIVAYVAVLFVIAQWAERSKAGKYVSKYSGVYALGLAVYCTTWTYYGSVGKASTGGMGFLPVYLGPTLGLLLGWTIFRRIVRLKHAHRITSIADFISSRYGKSQAVAAMVTVIMMVGIIPYVGLQLKAVTGTFVQITAGSTDGAGMAGWFSPIIATLMTIFTIAFGIRHIDPTERHPGMVVSLAIESTFKLVAFLVAGFFIVKSAFGGLGGFVESFTANPPDLPMLKAGDSKQIMVWITVTLLSMSAFSFLPRQFHVGVVENGDPEQVKKAAWLTPLYLIAINLLVVPIAMGGSLLAEAGTTGDQFVLAIPVQSGQAALSLGVFIGGFSAAIGMIMISSMTMATMISNHLVMPLISAVPALSFLRRRMLYVRWVAAAGFIFAGYGFEVGVGDSYMLVAIGLISFAAAFIVAPVVLIGLFWRNASRGGALLGLGSGFVFWAYTLFMPSLIKSGWLPESILEHGAFGLSALRPEALFGLAGLPSLTHGVLFSGVATITGLLAGSVLFPSKGEERALTDEFLDEGEGGFSHLDDKNRTIDVGEKREATLRVLGKYFDHAEAGEMCQTCFQEAGVQEQEKLTVVEMAELHSTIEKHLAGAVGAASAHGAMKDWGTIDRQDSKSLARSYGKMLAKLKLSPKELKERIDFQQERESLLSEQFRELQKKIDERDAEIVERQKAEVALQAAHDELEDRVELRTAELNKRNKEMRLVFDTVNQGFITIDLEGSIGAERSRVVSEWFGVQDGPVQSKLHEVLAGLDERTGTALEMGLEQVKMGILPLDVSLDQLPTAFEADGRYYEADYHPTGEIDESSDESPDNLLVVVSDATARVQQERSEERQKEVVGLFERFMNDRNSVLSFLGDGDSLIEQITAWREGDEDVLIRRNLHTLKGNAGIMAVGSIARLCHALEEQFENGALSPEDSERLANEWKNLRGRIDDIVDTETDTIELEPRDYDAILKALNTGRPAKDIEALVLGWKLEPTRKTLSRLGEQVSRLAEELGKGEVDVVVEDNDVRLDAEEWGDFWSNLVHVVRNAVDHGLEEPSERESAGKNPNGKVTLRTEDTVQALTVVIEDDGRGINWDALRKKCKTHGLPYETQSDLVEALFADGVSTRDEVSTTSGRGVGMAAVRGDTEARGGSVKVDSRPGKGTRWTFRFPKAAPAKVA
ncbi:MAG: ATP-binding protein [Nannocystales bacterium]